MHGLSRLEKPLRACCHTAFFMSSKLPIVILTTGEPVPSIREKRGSFATLIAERIGSVWTGEYLSVDVRELPAEHLPNPRSAAAFIITGSAANIPDREAWMLKTEAYLRDLVPSGAPVFGICFGHQILAQALGGLVIKNPRGREMGTKSIERKADDFIFEGLDTSFFVNATHIDTVAQIPPGAYVLARSPLDDHQVIRFSPTCYGVQFHPEFDAEVMRGYISSRRSILENEGFSVDAMLEQAGDGRDAQRLLQNFVKRVVLQNPR